MLRATGRRAASRLASSIGSATQSYTQELDAPGELAPPLVQPERMGSGLESFCGDPPTSSDAAPAVVPPQHSAPLDLGGANRNSDAISIMTAALRPRVPDAAALGGRHGGSVNASGRPRREGESDGGSSSAGADTGSSPKDSSTGGSSSSTREKRTSPARLSELHASTEASGTLASSGAPLPPRPTASGPLSQRNNSVVIGLRSSAVQPPTSHAGRGLMGSKRFGASAAPAPLSSSDAHSDEESAWGGADAAVVARPLLRGRFLSRISERVPRAGSDNAFEDDDAAGDSASGGLSSSDEELKGRPAATSAGRAASSAFVPPRSSSSPWPASGLRAPSAQAVTAPPLSPAASACSEGGSVDSWEEDERRMLAELASQD